MKKYLLKIVGWSLLGTVLIFLLISAFAPPTCVIHFHRAHQEAIAIGEAATKYAEEHEGRLPETLSQLTPAYLPDPTALSRTHLTTPGVLLKDLPPSSIIAIKVGTDPQLKWATQVFLIHADRAVEADLR